MSARTLRTYSCKVFFYLEYTFSIDAGGNVMYRVSNFKAADETQPCCIGDLSYELFAPSLIQDTSSTGIAPSWKLLRESRSLHEICRRRPIRIFVRDLDARAYPWAGKPSSSRVLSGDWCLKQRANGSMRRCITWDRKFVVDYSCLSRFELLLFSETNIVLQWISLIL